MPVLITKTARAQYLDMVRRYLQPMPHRPPRPEAAMRLVETYDAALAHTEAGPSRCLTHPRPYPDLARYGFRWIKLHRYWFAWYPGHQHLR